MQLQAGLQGPQGVFRERGPHLTGVLLRSLPHHLHQLGEVFLEVSVGRRGLAGPEVPRQPAALQPPPGPAAQHLESARGVQEDRGLSLAVREAQAMASWCGLQAQVLRFGRSSVGAQTEPLLLRAEISILLIYGLQEEPFSVLAEVSPASLAIGEVLEAGLLWAVAGPQRVGRGRVPAQHPLPAHRRPTDAQAIQMSVHMQAAAGQGSSIYIAGGHNA
mmetsp:Transcript_12772/g.19185  ORF Transcript_12772/g.19185 Transcript_12772/m.19185 type:complete len:218 (-) Transcript_12772:936-1589(-)